MNLNSKHTLLTQKGLFNMQEERLNEITKILNSKKVISLHTLEQTLFVSKSTIRRDLIHLENLGIAQRVRGGAKLVQDEKFEYPSNIRNLDNQVQKAELAKSVSRFLKNGMTIFLDSSSTTSFLCPLIERHDNITVITNSIRVADYFSHSNIDVYIAGGKVKQNSESILGTNALEFISQFNVDIVFLSCKCLDDSFAYEVDLNQADIKRSMLANSDMSVLMCDNSKLNKTSLHKLASLDEFTHVFTNDNL